MGDLVVFPDPERTEPEEAIIHINALAEILRGVNSEIEQVVQEINSSESGPILKRKAAVGI